ncbi:retrovirus-related pol polyprotein from transposon TNT 1-94 [Tanacetum coccineum]|uniref:Retrovirus-related pol polyprotein from transposon TNT 1-94 n=1 Tax=Tanacetum coccineum TaxID=301880 RepID=A0ABQ5BFC1_9ASTR
MQYDSTTGMYKCQLDEQWFNLDKEIIRDALDITPANDSNPFVALPSSDTVIEYVNTLGYPCTLKNVSAMPRHPVLQILWGIIHRSNIDYAERIWEEFFQSILTFLTDKKNLIKDARGKKKSNLLLILSIRFTRLITHYLKTKHNFHLRTNSPLHYSHDKTVLGTLRSIGKDGREVFGMPIPDALLTEEIKKAPYYGEYLKRVEKYQKYLDEERSKAKEGGATKSTKTTKVIKPKATKQVKDPTSAPTESTKKDQGKKRKLVKESFDSPSPAKQSKAGKVTKKRKTKSSLQLVDEGDDEGVPEKEPVYGDEDAELQQALEISLKDQGKHTQGPARSVVIREPNSRRIQPLLETPKKKTHADQFIFQRRTPAPTEPSSHDESSSLYVELGLTNSKTESDEDVSPEINAGAQDEDQAGLNPGEQDEGQARPNPGVQDEGQAGSNPGDAAVSLPQSSHGVHVGPNLELVDFEVTDASTQQNPEQLDEEFTTMAYLNVQENLKLPTEDQFRLEKPASSAGTLSSLQNLDKELSFTNQFLVDKSQEDEPKKTNTKTEVQSMVIVPIHQDTSLVPLMTSPVIDLMMSQSVSTAVQAPLPTSTATVTAITTTTSLPPPPPPQQQQSTADLILIQRIGKLEQHLADLVQTNLDLEERLDKHGTRLYNLENLNIPHQSSKAVDEIITDAVDWTMQAPLCAHFRDLPTVDMKEVLQQRMFEDKYYLAYEDHKNLYEALEKSLENDYSNQLLSDLEEARRKKRKRRASPRTPSGSPPSPLPPPPPPAGASGAPASIPESMAWTTTDTRFESTGIYVAQESSPNGSPMHDDYISNDQAYEVVKPFYQDVIHLQFQIDECHKLLTDQVDWTNPEGNQVSINVNRPLPLGGPPGHLTIQTQFFFNKDLEYLRYGNKGSCPALSISKMKAARYPDFGLELLMPEQMWIDDVCTYDIRAKYGIAHWWFNRQKFYIDRHDSLSRRKEVRSHMRILSVVRIKAYSRYRYDYLSEIVLRRAEYQEHMIVEKDFKNLYPSDFEDLNLLLLQGHLDHLSGSDKRMLSTAVKLCTRNLMIRQLVEDFQLGIKSYQTQLKLTKPRWDAKGYEFKHDYTIIESPRAIVFPVDHKDRKIMRFNKIYKFSDGTLSRILEALDYRVKEFKIKRLNLGMNTRFWTQKDVTRHKEFMAAIERRLKMRRIFQNLECFVGGRVRDIDYRLLQRTE